MAAGMIQTVLGDVDPSSSGVTLSHEHLLVSLTDWPRTDRQVERDQQDHADTRAIEAISLENVSWVRRHRELCVDNLRLDDEDVIIDEVLRFKRAGGGAIVELSIVDLRRNPEGMARISRGTGIHVIAGSGHYVNDAHPLDMDARTEEQLTKEIVGDITRGIEGTTIKAGIIGEIGCSAPMTHNERKSLRAAARAQRATGAAINIHPGRSERAPFEAIEVLLDSGGDPARTIMSHIDRTLFDQRDMIDLAGTGCYIEFDLFGQESSYYALAPIDMPNDAMRINHLQRLIAEGFGDKLLVSQDVCHKTDLVKYGGTGYAHIVENVIPVMKRKGMTESQIESILVHNPARVLTMTDSTRQ